MVLTGLIWLIFSAAFVLVATPVSAQEATSDQPGVIQRGGDEDNEQEDQQEQDQAEQQQQGQQQGQPGAQQQGGAQQGSPESQGQVITPDNASPNEKYNLPPNFDPNYRPKRTPSNTKVTIDFREANLEEVVKFFSGAMELNFIIADSIQANKTITIISPKDVTLDQAYRAFLAALEMNGLTVVRMGEFLKIVQSKQAISEPQPTYGEGDTLPNEARMVTAILPVENADVEKVKGIIGNFTSPAATVVTYQNKLIVSENASNLKRIRNLIDRIDTGEAGEQVFVYDVRYADATKISDKLSELFDQQGQRRGGQQGNQEAAQKGLGVDVSQLIADERTNQLIVVTDKDSFDKIKDMIKLLDKPTQVGGQVHVKFLDYADADELSSTLSSLVSAAQQGNERGGGGARRPQQAEGAGGEVAAMLSGEVQITSYKPNNALVIVASPKDYVAVEHVVNKLDRPRKQVYVEAVIMELSLDTNRELGIGYSAGLGQDFGGLVPESAVEQGLIDDTQGLAVGQSNFQGVSSLGNALQGTGGSLGLLGPLLSVPGLNIPIPAFSLLLRATQTDDRVNILSTPSIMTLDNEEAEITVGQRVPFLQGLGGGGGGGLGGLGGLLGQGAQQGQQGAGGLGGLGALGGLGGLVSPIEYKDVGLTLRIKPQVNDSRYVRLEVEQEVSDIASAGSDQLTPTTSERNAQTVVLAKDQSTIVIGGLMRDRKVETVQKVPFLGDIPLIGALFRKNTTITTKQNLVLMLTPYIIESDADLRKIRNRKMEERREMLEILAQEKEGYQADINYQKKSGLVGRMRKQLSTAIEEKEAREAAREAFDEDGPRYRILGDDSGNGGNENSQSNDTSQNNGGSGNQ